MSKYIRLVSTVISSIIVKEERRGEIDIPKTSMTGVFQRINDDQYWPVILQLLVQNVDPSYESFEDNKNSVIFLMESIIDRIGKAKNVAKYSKIFEKWIDSRSNQNQNQLQSEEYLCAFFTFSIDKKFGSDGLGNTFHLDCIFYNIIFRIFENNKDS